MDKKKKKTNKNKAKKSKNKKKKSKKKNNNNKKKKKKTKRTEKIASVSPAPGLRGGNPAYCGRGPTTLTTRTPPVDILHQ